MLKKIILEVDKPFIGTYPIRTGPNFERVEGTITEIYLAAGKVEVRGPNKEDIWVISLEDAICKNKLLDRIDY